MGFSTRNQSFWATQIGNPSASLEVAQAPLLEIMENPTWFSMIFPSNPPFTDQIDRIVWIFLWFSIAAFGYQRGCQCICFLRVNRAFSRSCFWVLWAPLRCSCPQIEPRLRPKPFPYGLTVEVMINHDQKKWGARLSGKRFRPWNDYHPTTTKVCWMSRRSAVI